MIGEGDGSAVGLISMGIATEKRIFIDFMEVLPWPVTIEEYIGCAARQDTLTSISYKDVFGPGGFMPVNPYFRENNPFPYAFQSAPRFCVDCRERGGTIVMPEFWEN
ncbi:hypothetical protein [Belliella filtrata]|nr:hypothetical protein [Belliella filtrata]